MRRFYRAFAFLLLLTTILVPLCACPGNTPAAAPAATDAAAEAEGPGGTEAVTEAAPVIPVKDFGGYCFRIYAQDYSFWAGIGPDLYIEEENGDILDDEVYRRNSRIAEKYNVTFSYKEDLKLFDGLTKMTAANSYDYDVFFPNSGELYNFITSKSLLDLNTLTSMNLDEPWYDQNSRRTLNINRTQYAVVSNLTLLDKYCTVGMFFNKKMFEDYGLPDIYQIVENNAWNFDELQKLSRDVSADLDGNGVMDPNDRYGISGQNSTTYVLLHAGNVRLAEPADDGTIQVALDKEKTITMIQKIYEIMSDTELFFNRQSYNPQIKVEATLDMFANSQLLFMVRPLQSVVILRSMENDFGIIPVPQFFEGQDGYCATVLYDYSPNVVIPMVSEDPERTALLIEALSCDSWVNVLPVFYDKVLGTKVVRDKESAVMLDLMFANRVFDLGVFMDFGGIRTFIGTEASKNGDIVSLYAANENKIKEAIAKFLESL